MSGPYALYVAAAYAISLGGIFVLTAWVWIAWHKAKRRLAARLKLSETNL